MREKKNGVINECLMNAEVLAYQGKYKEAADVFAKGDYPEKAVELFTLLKKWDDAKKFAKKAEQHMKKNQNGG